LPPELACPHRNAKEADDGVNAQATMRELLIYVRFGSLADKPSVAEIHRCPLWSKSGQTRVRLECPLCANLSRAERDRTGTN
jgi:hypothetical protein